MNQQNLSISERLTRRETKASTKHDHYARLLSAMHGVPSEWEWDGNIIEDKDGKCACGHKIRWCFPLVHTKGQFEPIVVGSVCVENAPGISPQLVEQMKVASESLRKLIAERKKQEKEMAQDKEIAELLGRREKMREMVRSRHADNQSRGGMSSRIIWMMAVGKWGFKRVDAYKSKSASIARLKVEVDAIEKALKREE